MVETLSNSSAAQLHESSYSNASATLSLQTGIYEQFLKDLRQIKCNHNSIHNLSKTANKSFTSNQYLDGAAYCILFQSEVKFYFINNAKVVSIDLPGNVEVESSQNIFLFEAQQQVLGINGYLAVIFGLHTYTLIHIDSQYTQPSSLGYQIISVKNYLNIQAGNQEALSFVRLAEAAITIIPRSNFPQQELAFYLGSSSNQKVVSFKVFLRADPESSALSLSSVLTSCEEVLIHQEVKTLKSRLSTFISSKIYGAGENDGQNAGCIKAIEIVQNFVFVVTSKDIFIVRRSDNAKVYEREYFDSAKEWSAKIDKLNNPTQMKELLDFRLLCTSSTLIVNPQMIAVTLIFVKRQAIQAISSDHFFNMTQLIQRTLHFVFDETQTQIEDRDEKGNNMYQFYDISRYSKEQLSKGFAFSYQIPQDNEESELGLIVGAEFIDGKVVAVEHLVSSRVDSIKECTSKMLTGYSANLYNDLQTEQPVIKISLMSKSDVETYEFLVKNSSLCQTQPQSLEQMLINAHQLRAMIPQMPQYEEQPEQSRIAKIDQLRPFIYSLFEKIAAYKFQTDKPIDEAKANVFAEIQQSIYFAQSQKVEKINILAEIKDILMDVIDLKINDSHFQNVNTTMDSFNQVFHDDGLVQTSLESKSKQLDVISEFLFSFLISPNPAEQDQEDREINHLIYSLQFKLTTAIIFRNIQENIKENLRHTGFRHQTQFQTITDYPLEMRLISSVIQNCSRNYGYQDEDLRTMGVTSSNVVYSAISRFDQVISNMLQICLDSNTRLYIQMTSNETDQQLSQSACNILNNLFQEYVNTFQRIPTDSFLNNQDYLDLIFKFAERFSSGIKAGTQDMRPAFEKLADQFMVIIGQLNLQETEAARFWLTKLVIQLENACGNEKALDFAEKYRARELLCRLVFDLGRDKYDYIHRCVDNWGFEFLDIAIETIYYQEKNAVKDKKPNYSFQMFEIFEEKYYPQLRDFIAPKNKKLLALLALRHAESDEAHQLLKNQVIPNIQSVETMKVLSSVAVSNLDKLVTNVQMKQEEGNYLSSKLFIAEVQSKVLPDEERLISEITPQYLIQVLNHQENNQDPEQKLRTIFKLINSERADARANTQDLKFFAWKSLINNDQEQITKVVTRISSGDSQFALYSDHDIVQSIEKTLLYQFTVENFNQATALDDEVHRALLDHRPDLAVATTKIIQQAKSKNPALLFQPANHIPLQSSMMNIS